MRVSMPTIFHNIQSNLQKLAEDLQAVNIGIASGRKYQSISDSPLDVGEIMGLETEASQMTQFQRNLDTGRNWLASTEVTIQKINDIVQETMALANQMATGTYNAAQRAAAAQQVQGYIEEIMQLGNTRVQDQYILSGYKTDTPPFVMGDWQIREPVMYLQPGSTGQVIAGGSYTGTASRTYLVEISSGGATGVATFRVSDDGGRTWSEAAVTGIGVALGTEGVLADFSGNWRAGDRFYISASQPILYQGDKHIREISIGPQSRLAVTQVGSEAVGGAGGLFDVFQVLARLKGSLEANDPQGAGAALEELRTCHSHLTGILASLGAALNRVNIKSDVLETLKGELTDKLSIRGDTDPVEAVNALKTKETAYQAALLASAKVMNLSLLDYL
jgi:flagellar hook-associated protein 3 FlgL|uniref:Flagellin N-terminal domain-containing protein n=1 Tax=Desulfobacca acetoxidans TaxID=60893 RepID=A0A7C3WIG6_9BACT